MDGVWDILVVGAGIEGSATAHHAAKAGYKTVLLEQFALPHSRGSSHGQSRIIRKAYDQVYYADMMEEAYSSWEQLEKESASSLYTKSGLLVMECEHSVGLTQVKQALTRLRSIHTVLDHTQLAAQYPMLTLPPDIHGVFDPQGGVLAADRALRALQMEFVKLGGTIRDGDPVVRVEPGDTVRVVTRDTTYTAKSIVMAAGPWTGKLCQQLQLTLPLQPRRVGVYYWPLKESSPFRDQAPCMIFNDEKVHAYLLPDLEYPRMFKVCLHTGPPIDPDERDLATSESETYLTLLQSFVRKHLPFLQAKPSIVESCIYTMTPDEDFILDSHPKWKNIVIGAGFSGHGFKLAPVVGKILMELATGQRPSYDLAPFRISRFISSQPSKL